MKPPPVFSCSYGEGSYLPAGVGAHNSCGFVREGKRSRSNSLGIVQKPVHREDGFPVRTFRRRFPELNSSRLQLVSDPELIPGKPVTVRRASALQAALATPEHRSLAPPETSVCRGAHRDELLNQAIDKLQRAARIVAAREQAGSVVAPCLDALVSCPLIT